MADILVRGIDDKIYKDFKKLADKSGDSIASIMRKMILRLIEEQEMEKEARLKHNLVMEKLKKIREKQKKTNKGKFFPDSVELIRKMREEA